MNDTLLDIVICPDDTPSEAEFYVTDGLVAKITIDSQLSRESILDTRLLELFQLVVALALE